MPGRSKWLDPARMAHGVKWRSQVIMSKRRPPPPTSQPTSPPIPLTRAFETAVLDSFGVKEISELDPTAKMWAEFTLTSVERGWQAVERMGGPKAFRGRRVIDVGCAYGGFLVAAGYAGARELVGVDIDQKLLDLAGLLLSDHQAKAELSIADITDPKMPERLGGFDVVFCNDVLEHVVELDEAAHNLARLVKTGGRLFLEIPNGMAIRYIDSDGHYKLPGITLLDHTDAERWFRAFYEDRYPYRTFFYAPLDYYLTLFSGQRMSLRLLNAPSPDSKVVSDLAESWAETLRRLQALDREFPDKPADLIEQIQARSLEENTRIQRLLTTATTSHITEERRLTETVFRTTFGLESFLLEGRMAG